MKITVKRTPPARTHPTPAWSQSLPYWASDERRPIRAGAARPNALRRIRSAWRARSAGHG